MPPELRRLLRWTIPAVLAIILAYNAWQDYLFSVAHGGESCEDTACRLKIAQTLALGYGLLLPAAFWLGQPRNGWLGIAALAGVVLSERMAYRLAHEGDHGMAEVWGWDILILFIMAMVGLGLLVIRLLKRQRAG